MIEWRDEGILLFVRRHGEGSAIIDVLTAEHGRVSGVVRGGASRKMAPILQPGAQLDVTWKARLEEHLGSARVELIQSRAAVALAAPSALAALNSICAMITYVLPERVPDDATYQRAQLALDGLNEIALWPLAYLSCELSLLHTAGVGLQLERCTVTGAQEGLGYISPKSGAAVSVEAAGDWAPKLLTLAPALRGQAHSPSEVRDALDVLTYFWEAKFAPQIGKPLPASRARLIDALSKI